MYARIYNKSAGRIPEDEVTSCVFGPLRTMAAVAPARTWAACLHLFQCGHLYSEDFEPTDVCVRFWPRFATPQGGYVEPDVHVIARCGANVRTILVEVKCKAALERDQLLRQWEHIQLPTSGSSPVVEGDELRRRSTHVLLGYVRPRHRMDIDVQEVRARAAGVAWGGRLVTLTWGQFALLLQTLPETAESLRKDALKFLQKSLEVIPVAPFEGINLASLVPVSKNLPLFPGLAGMPLHDLRAVATVRWAFPDESVTT